MNIRDWLEPMLREWGSQRRRILSGRLVRKDGTVHEDGWPTTSVAAAALGGGITGGSGTAHQHFPEVYSGDGLVVWRGLANAPIEIREILHLHYVVTVDFDGSLLDATRKAEILAISRKQYYTNLREAQAYLAGRIDRASDAASVATA